MSSCPNRTDCDNHVASLSDDSADCAPLDLEQLKYRCLGHLELVERLLASFEGRFLSEVAEIEESLRVEDVPRLVRLAHQLKGAAANISAPALRSVTQRIEEAGRAHHLEDIAPCLTQLHSEWDRFRQYKASVSLSATSEPGKSRGNHANQERRPENSPCAY